MQMQIWFKPEAALCAINKSRNYEWLVTARSDSCEKDQFTPIRHQYLILASTFIRHWNEIYKQIAFNWRPCNLIRSNYNNQFPKTIRKSIDPSQKGKMWNDRAKLSGRKKECQKPLCVSHLERALPRCQHARAGARLQGLDALQCKLAAQLQHSGMPWLKLRGLLACRPIRAKLWN